MKLIYTLFFILLFLVSCSSKTSREPDAEVVHQESSDTLGFVAERNEEPKKEISIRTELLYDKYTLEDIYPYKDTTRIFQLDKIKKGLAFLDSIQSKPAKWGILQNYKNKNGEAPLVKEYKRNEYKRIADLMGVERYQSVALYPVTDSLTAERYGRDGALVKIINDLDSSSNFMKIETLDFDGDWLIQKRYIKKIEDTVVFKKAIFVDVMNQNIITFEKDGSEWLIRSKNPATTGLHNPPHMQETPTGLFVIQERKNKMYFLVDGTTRTGGFAPYASRFTNGGYIHGVPVNTPRTQLIEYSKSLGTTPRSHMCVRNATSHAKFVYDWVIPEQTVVFVID